MLDKQTNDCLITIEVPQYVLLHDLQGCIPTQGIDERSGRQPGDQAGRQEEARGALGGREGAPAQSPRQHHAAPALAAAAQQAV